MTNIVEARTYNSKSNENNPNYDYDDEDDDSGVSGNRNREQEINDNKKEIDEFFKVCSAIGIKTVARAVNHVESKMSTTTNKVIETSVIKCYEYFAQQAKKYGMDLQAEPWADAIVENKVYNCRKR